MKDFTRKNRDILPKTGYFWQRFLEGLEDGEEALDIYGIERVDILMDRYRRCPIWMGWEFCRRVREKSRSIPLLFIYYRFILQTGVSTWRQLV